MESYWDFLPKELQLYTEGKLYTDNDLPAVIYFAGGKEWYKEWKLHRDNDLPAWICVTGHKKWHREGKYIELVACVF